VTNAADGSKVKVKTTTLTDFTGAEMTKGFKKVDPGNYRVTAEADGYFALDTSAAVRSGAKTELKAVMVSNSDE
jgi:hypothetical protein